MHTINTHTGHITAQIVSDLYQNENVSGLLMNTIESYVALVLTKFNSKHPTNSSISFSLTSLCWRFGLRANHQNQEHRQNVHPILG